jgi:hypothetical protein
MSLTLAAWITFFVVALVWVLMLKMTVRVVGGGRLDNGWDNALAYTMVTALLAIPVSWMFGSWFLAVLIPPFVWLAQTIAIKVIYEVKPLLAWTIGLVHAVLASFVVGTVTLTAGFVAAYIMYGKIISDPMFLVRLILRLIGIELPA